MNQRQLAEYRDELARSRLAAEQQKHAERRPKPPPKPKRKPGPKPPDTAVGTLAAALLVLATTQSTDRRYLRQLARDAARAILDAQGRAA